MATFLCLLISGLDRGTSVPGDPSSTAAAEAQAPTRDDEPTTPGGAWAAIWFPGPVPVSDPDAPAAPGPSAVARQPAMPNRADSSSDAAVADDPTVAPAVVETGMPVEILAVFDAGTSVGEAARVTIKDDAINPPTSVLPSTLAFAGSASLPHAPQVLRDVPPAAPQVLDLRHPLAPAHLTERIAWHLDQGVHEVSLDLHPLELGRIEIRIRLEGERVELRFDTAEVAVRDVVQTSLPQLAAMLSARGLALDQAQVFAQARALTPTPSSPGQLLTAAEIGGARPKSSSASLRAIRRSLIDDYV
ncbi:MAG: flagellar hook-length control protein FliK [Panacagrimonas sp.]